MLATWARRYLHSEEEKDQENVEPEKGKVVVESRGSGFLQHIASGRHRFVSDEPEDLGGGDEGADPYALLLAGLGACTGMTVRMYAERKGWPLERVRVTLEHSRVHAEDCGECETEQEKIDYVEGVLCFEGDLSGEQLDRLTEIAGHCPVHRTLTSETKVETRREEPEE